MKRFTISLCLLIVLVTSPPVQKGFDLVGPLTRTAFGCLAEQGYGYAIVRAAALNGTVDPTTVQTLTNAQAAGLQTAIYMVICPRRDFLDQLSAVISAIPANLYSSTIWFKIIKNIPGCTWQGLNNQSDNCQAFGFIIQQAVGAGLIVGFSATKNLWMKLLGFDCPFGQLGFVNLWYSNYKPNGGIDTTESFDDFTAFGGFGGWEQPNLKQVAGSGRVTLCNNPAWHALINANWHE